MSKKVCATLLALLLILNCCTFGHFHLNAQKTNDKIADLAARLEEAETKIVAANSAIEEVKAQEETDKASTDTAIAGLEAGLASANTAIEEVRTQVQTDKTATDTAIADLKTGLALANTAIDEVRTQEETDKAATDTAITGLAAGLASANAAIDEVKTQAETDKTATDTAIAGLETGLASANTAIEEVRTQVQTDKASTDTAIAGLETGLASANTAIEEVRTQVQTDKTATDTAIAGLGTGLASANTAIEEVRTQEETDKAATDTAIAGLATGLASANAAINEVRTQAETDKTATDAALADLETGLASANIAIDEVKTQAETDKAATDTALAVLDSADATIDAVITELETYKNGKKITVLMSDEKAEVELDKLYQVPAFNNARYLRKNITSIVFEQSDSQKNDTAWDVSQDRTGSVLAWVDSANGLHIAPAEGYSISFPESCCSLFAGYTNVVEIVFGAGIDTSNVTDTSFLFANCSKLVRLDISGLETSNVTDMCAMFDGCRSLTELDVSRFDTSKVTNMNGMFFGCSSLKELDVSGFDTSNVTDMMGMFIDCTSLTELDVSKFDTSSVAVIRGMFLGCTSLKELDVSRFNTNKVTSIKGMFLDCISLTKLDVSGFNTSNVTDMSGAFSNCNNLKSLDVSGFDTSNVTVMNGMFLGCSSLTELDVRGFDTSNVTNMSCMFANCNKMESLDVSGFDTSNVSDMSFMFFGCSSLTKLDISGFDMQKVTEKEGMLEGCTGVITEKPSAKTLRNQQIKVGDTVTFGGYEQDGNVINGKEAIEWIVLSKEDGQAVLISKYGLETKPYNEEYASVTWETCTLRKWLNGEFYNTAFSAEEQAQIVATKVAADKNPKYNTDPGKDTKDKVWLLSITEANKYFANDNARVCYPTRYAESSGTWTSNAGACWWWLRSPGEYGVRAARIAAPGSVFVRGEYVNGDAGCVRPVIMLRLSSEPSGTEVTGTALGFGGEVAIKMTVDGNTITSFEVTSAAYETPGIGSCVLRPEFAASMIGKNLPLSIDSIDAIAGATVTSTAVVNAANAAFEKIEAVNKAGTANVQTTVSNSFMGVASSSEATREQTAETERKVYVTSNCAGEDIPEGTQVVLTAHVEGFKNENYIVHWQYTPDGGKTVVDAGTGMTHSYQATHENAHWVWRAVVEVYR